VITSRGTSRYAPLTLASGPFWLECCRDYVGRWVGGDVVVRCRSCRAQLGTARYTDVSIQLPIWAGGNWSATSLEPPLVPTGIDLATGMPSYGLRARARFDGATPTRGRVPGRPPVRESKQTSAAREAVVHCPKCGHRAEVRLPVTWPGSAIKDSGHASDPVPSQIEWSYWQRGKSGHFPDCPHATDGRATTL